MQRHCLFFNSLPCVEHCAFYQAAQMKDRLWCHFPAWFGLSLLSARGCLQFSKTNKKEIRAALLFEVTAVCEICEIARCEHESSSLAPTLCISTQKCVASSCEIQCQKLAKQSKKEDGSRTQLIGFRSCPAWLSM